MKRINFKKILLTLMLCLVLAFSSPLAVLAGEAEGAQEASTAAEAGSAPGAAPAPEADASPTPSPLPPPDITTSSTDSQNYDGYDWDNDDEDVDEDDLNLDGDEWVSSGRNSSGNVGDTSITTGNAGASGTVITSANNTTVSGPSACSACVDDVSVKNSGNGTNSNNSAGVDVGSDSSVVINNDANVNNNLTLSADSGSNAASYNVGDSEIETGDANVSGVVITSANETGLGIVEYNILEDYTGDIILAVPDGLFGCGTCGSGGDISAVNSGNGADSANSIEVDSDNTTDTTINNDADIVNTLDLLANSGSNQSNTTLNNFADIDNILNIDATKGDNKTSYNTGGDNSIETGDVFVNAEVLNIVNTNLLGASDEPLWLILVNNMGSWTGSIIGALTGTNYSGSDGFVFTVDDDGAIVAANQGNGAGSTNDIGISQNNTNDLTE